MKKTEHLIVKLLIQEVPVRWKNIFHDLDFNSLLIQKRWFVPELEDEQETSCSGGRCRKDTKQTRDMSDRSTVYFYSRLWSLMTFILCGCWLQVQFCHRFLAVKRKFFLFTVTKRLLTAGAAVFLSEVYFSSETHLCTYCFHSVFFPANCLSSLHWKWKNT